MLRVKLNKNAVIKNLTTEEVLLDQSSVVDSLYIIRRLKGLIESITNGYIEVKNESNDYGQRYSEEFMVWFNKDEMSEI